MAIARKQSLQLWPVAERPRATRSGPSTSKPSVSNALICGVMLASLLMQLVEQRVSKPSLGGAARGTRPPHRLCGRTPHEPGRCIRCGRAREAVWRSAERRGVGLLRLQRLQGGPQPGDGGLEQPAVLVEQHPMVQGAGQQIERRLNLVAGGLQFETPREAGAAVALLAALDLDRDLFGPAFGATASIGLLAAVLSVAGPGPPHFYVTSPSAPPR